MGGRGVLIIMPANGATRITAYLKNGGTLEKANGQPCLDAHDPALRSAAR
jgi:hypothetical protein